MRRELSFKEAVGALERRQETRIRFGLARIRRLLARLEDPQEAFASVHVAGTNGKGSVCAMLDSVLRASGKRVGLYTSPHLDDVRERIRVGGRCIPRPAFARCLGRVLAAETEPLSYFELLTAAAFLHFRDSGVEVAVLETGLGGRLDATNVVKRPAACAISAIDLDHTDWLGGTLTAVAREKAGILKRGVPAFTVELKPAALKELARVARKVGAPLERVPGRAGWRTVRVDWRRGRQLLSGPRGRRLWVGLLGAAQVRNVALVARIAGALGLSERSLVMGLASVRWPGRFEVLRRGRRRVILDGAHNPQAMDQFCRTLAASPWGRSPKLFVVGVLRDKDYRRMVGRLAPLVEKAVAVRPPSPRALEPGRLAAELHAAAPGARITAVSDAAEAIEAWRANGSPVACVVGSFYLVGAARRALKAPRAA